MVNKLVTSTFLCLISVTASDYSVDVRLIVEWLIEKDWEGVSRVVI
jgi:hypothetical protein